MRAVLYIFNVSLYIYKINETDCGIYIQSPTNYIRSFVQRLARKKERARERNMTSREFRQIWYRFSPLHSPFIYIYIHTCATQRLIIMRTCVFWILVSYAFVPDLLFLILFIFVIAQDYNKKKKKKMHITSENKLPNRLKCIVIYFM